MTNASNTRSYFGAAAKADADSDEDGTSETAFAFSGYNASPWNAFAQSGLLRQQSTYFDQEEIATLSDFSDVQAELSPEPSAEIRNEAASVSTFHISSTLESFEIEDYPIWSEIERTLLSPSLFAIECNPLSVDIDRRGRFRAIATVVVHSQVKGLEGRPITASTDIPAVVSGNLDSTGRIDVSDFNLLTTAG